jgi:transposase
VPGPEVTLFACDVAKDKVDLYTEIAGREVQRCIATRAEELEAQLTTLASLARESGAQRIVVLAEPTGCYHEPLLRAAHRVHLETAWVSGEAVHKMRVVEFNDTGKTDLKDPRVIYTLGRMGKTLVHRPLEEPYSLLREWNSLYDASDVRVVEIKNALHIELHDLFPAFSFKTDFLFGRGGQALMKHYRLNPYRIVEAGLEAFSARIRKDFPTIRKSSLARLFQDAESSVRTALPRRHAELREFRLRQLWQDWEREKERKLLAKQAMENLYAEARRLDPRLPEGQKGVVTTFHLARIVGETGPLSDFAPWRKLLRYAGLNLRERQSGRYRGQTRTSKKGRILLRKILSQIVLPLVKGTCLFGPYYHRKREEGGMPAAKAMTVVMRKFVKMLFGWYRAGGAFQTERVFQCESIYRKAA